MLQEQSKESNPYTRAPYTPDYSGFCLHIGHTIEIDPSERMELCQYGCLGENIIHVISGIILCNYRAIWIQFNNPLV